MAPSDNASVNLPPIRDMRSLWRKPDLKDIKVFGCAALVHIEQRYMPKDPSLPHRKPAIFVGMCEKSPSWRFLIPSTNKVISSDSAEFFEDRPGIQVGTTELAPAVPNDAIMPCPSIEAVASAPVAPTKPELEVLMDEATTAPSSPKAEASISSHSKAAPTAAISPSKAVKKTATSPSEVADPAASTNLTSKTVTFSEGTDTVAAKSKPSSSKKGMSKAPRAQVVFDGKKINVPLPDGTELIKTGNEADCLAKAEQAMARPTTHIIMRLPASDKAMPYMQVRHAKVTGMTAEQARHVQYKDSKGNNQYYGSKDFRYDVRMGYVGICRPFAGVVGFAAGSRDMALPEENITQTFVQAWKERTGKPMRKPGMPVLPSDVIDDELLECAMRCNDTFRSVYKGASRDIYEDFCLLATSHNHGEAAESFVDDALSNILLNDEPLSRLEALKRSDWKLQLAARPTLSKWQRSSAC